MCLGQVLCGILHEALPGPLSRWAHHCLFCMTVNKDWSDVGGLPIQTQQKGVSEGLTCELWCKCQGQGAGKQPCDSQGRQGYQPRPSGGSRLAAAKGQMETGLLVHTPLATDTNNQTLPPWLD